MTEYGPWAKAYAWFPRLFPTRWVWLEHYESRSKWLMTPGAFYSGMHVTQYRLADGSTFKEYRDGEGTPLLLTEEVSEVQEPVPVKVPYHYHGDIAA